MRNLVRIFVALAAILLTVSVGLALAHDHRPPKSMLFSGESRQAGRTLHYTWIRPYNANSCLVSFAHGVLRFPKPIPYRIGDQARIRLRKPSAPTYVELEAWNRVSKKGRPKGDPTPIPFRLEPHLVDGAIAAWDIVFVLPAGEKHFYMLATADWPDEDGCHPPPDVGSQYVIWQFHLRAR